MQFSSAMALDSRWNFRAGDSGCFLFVLEMWEGLVKAMLFVVHNDYINTTEDFVAEFQDPPALTFWKVRPRYIWISTQGLAHRSRVVT